MRVNGTQRCSHPVPARGDALTTADAITVMMLMNSTARFLIEEQVAGAPFIAERGGAHPDGIPDMRSRGQGR